MGGRGRFHLSESDRRIPEIPLNFMIPQQDDANFVDCADFDEYRASGLSAVVVDKRSRDLVSTPSTL